MYLFKTVAIIERITSNACNAVGNCDACKTVATRECIIFNACNAIGDCDACQP